MSDFAKGTTRKQSGAALLAFLFVFVTAAGFALLKGLNETATKQHRDAQTINALAEAKAALIGYAAGANIIPTNDGNVIPGPVNNCAPQCPRPGDLPCPDRNNDGSADTPCATAARRIGRLPWKQLGTADLHDGSGERFWYAVSTNFKNIPKTLCNPPTQVVGCLHSGSRGTITVRNANGTVRHDGTNSTAAIAVIFAPGPVLQRQGAGASQNRACTNCNATEVCLGTPATWASVPKCNPANYIDRRTSPSPSESNENFLDDNPNGFIDGPVYDAQGSLVINDMLAVVTYEDMMPLLEKRVVGEVASCLDAYAQVPANLNRYPWAAALDPIGSPPDYSDDGQPTPARFGRVPDGFPDPAPGNPNVEWIATDMPEEQFTDTHSNSSDIMEESWPLGKCLIVSRESKNTWWLNWKETVFYGVADKFKPGNAAPDPPTCSIPSIECLILAPETTSDTRFVVIAAGRTIGTQTRASNLEKGSITNYLEGENADPGTDEVFTARPPPPAFNDSVCKDGSCS